MCINKIKVQRDGKKSFLFKVKSIKINYLNEFSGSWQAGARISSKWK